MRRAAAGAVHCVPDGLRHNKHKPYEHWPCKRIEGATDLIRAVVNNWYTTALCKVQMGTLRFEGLRPRLQQMRCCCYC